AMTPAEEASLLHLHQYTPSVGYEGFTAAIPRVCIPMITEQDGAAGVATGMAGVTQLPAPVADAAAFDPSLAGRYGDVIGSEDAAKGVDLALSPTINIDRSPQWGRSYETLGEDPFLTASLAVPLVRGIQAHRVVSVVKHFAVYNQETHRATAADDSIVSDQALHEVYLPAFAAVTGAGQAGAMMCSYNLINGVPACQDGPLIDGILRRQWHFQGFVRSDCDSVYDQAGAMAVGVSQVKCTRLYNPTALAAAVTSGHLSRGALDGLARPLLTVLFRYDLIAAPHPADRVVPATTAAHQQTAVQTEEEGSVLLRNEANLLPLDFAHLGSLALIGPDDATPMPAGYGAMHVLPTHPVSVLAALRAELGSRVLYATGTNPADAVAIARHAQVAVVVVHDVESEHYDRTSLALPGNQDALVSAVANANPHTVVVLETGSAVLMPWIRSVPAILETWYPGQGAGTALAAILSGRVNPSGKLPVTFPASAAQMPDNTAATFGGSGGRTVYSDGVDVGYRWYAAHDVRPAFSFGYGLSYTRFGFSGLHATVAGGGVAVTATITNLGTRRGADVVQCYLGDPPGSGEPPRQLRAFQRVDLLPGQSQAVT
ncbi:MAG TPA: glycoside hydrolase family 3 C-terminal domain-containing protein, partial [Acidimicrobiales bacterium]